MCAASDQLSADARIRAGLHEAVSPAEIAAALDEIGGPGVSRRRRLQAELLSRVFRRAAEMAQQCGWSGRVLIADGQVLLEREGVLVPTTSSDFRIAGPSPATPMLKAIAYHDLGPRTIVDLAPGSGEAAIGLALRLPKTRVIAVESSPERMDILESNLSLQPQPLDNLELAMAWPSPEAPAGAWLRRIVESHGVRRIDLLKFEAGESSAALAAGVRALDPPPRAVCATLLRAEASHASLLEALSSKGLAMFEKASLPVTDPTAWLDQQLDERAAVTVWFVSGRRRQPLGRRRRTAAKPGVGTLHPFANLRTAVYSLLQWLRSRMDSTDKRFEFEALYASSSDPWRYTTNPYEALKYRRTLETIRKLRPEARSVLEIACSIGVFTRMLARSFPEVTAVDVASEALKIARRRVGGIGHVDYARGDIRSLRLHGRFELILCAEMLYYLPGTDAPRVLQALDRHLAPGGAVVIVMPLAQVDTVLDQTSEWTARLQERFRLVFREDFGDSIRPYTIRMFERTGA